MESATILRVVGLLEFIDVVRGESEEGDLATGDESRHSEATHHDNDQHAPKEPGDRRAMKRDGRQHILRCGR